MNSYSLAEKVNPTQWNQTVFIANLELPGCIGEFSISEPRRPRPQAAAQNVPVQIETPPKSYRIEFTLSPELFHINAPLLDQWFEQVGFTATISVQIFFRRQIKVETERHRLTTKLYQYGIDALGLNEKAGFKFDGFKFNLSEYNRSGYLSFKLEGKLENKHLSTIVEKLFKSQALWLHEPDLSEMFQGG